MTVFDRSWYGRVLVERVEELATREEWERAYGTIVEFERSFCEEGGVMVKFWMHVSDEEQLERFEERQDDPLKKWKITEDDWRNRGKRPLYAEAVEDMLERTDHAAAPWQLVEGDSKRFARVKVIETVMRGDRARDARARLPGAALAAEQRQVRLAHRPSAPPRPPPHTRCLATAQVSAPGA